MAVRLWEVREQGIVKSKRQAKMIEIIEQNEIETQDELAERLMEAGFVATQATISRDIHNMGLVKQNINGVLRYAAPKTVSTGETGHKLGEIFANCVVTVDRAKNLVVVKTLSGMAQAAASAIDNLHYTSEIVGCIAGDDTVMVIMRTDEDAINIQNKFIKLKK